MKRGRNLKFRLLIVLFLTFAVLQTPFALVNAPRFQQWFLKTYKPFRPWQVSFDSLQVRPWRLKIEIAGLKLSHPDGHQILVESIKLGINPLRLLRGQVAVRSLQVKSPTVNIARSLGLEKEGPKKKFKIRTLLLLQNLMVDKGRVENFTMHLQGGKIFKMENLDLAFHPVLLKGTKLALDLKEIHFQNELGEQKSIHNLKVAVTTNFSNWSKTFPYIDDVEGDISLQETSLGRLNLNRVEAKLRFDKGKLISKKFTIQVGEGFLQGKLEGELQSQKFSLNLETHKPIPLPEIGSEIRTFNTAGALTGSLNLEGQGFDIKTSQGKGNLSATHRFANFEDHPADVSLQFHWGKGVLHILEGKVNSDNATILAEGTLDLKPPNLHLNMKAENFPIQRFFEKFADKNLHPIHGKGNVQAQLNGLGKSIHLQLSGEALEGGYGPLLAEKAQANLEITYQHLKLDGHIFTGNKLTGEAQFLIDYGPKIPGQGPAKLGREANSKSLRSPMPRPKKISLLAKFHQQSLEKTLPGYYLTGGVDGELKLSGSPQDIRGEGTLHVSQGGFFDEGFDTIQTHFSLTNKKLVIDKADFHFSDFSSSFVKPLNLDFTPGGFKLWGQPLAGLNLEVLYEGQNKRWQINKLMIEDPANPALKSQVSGSLSPTHIDLKGKGGIEISRLKFLTKTIRDAGGPAQFQLSLHGALPNVQINGKVELDGNMLSLRAFPYSFEDLKGNLNFQGNRIQTDQLTGSLGAGSFQASGWLTHNQGKALGYDLKLAGKQLYYRSEKGEFRMEYDCGLALKGAAQNPELSGSLTILDGRYTKDFNIIEELKEAPKAAKEVRQAALEGSPLRLNVRVRNLGDLLIDNNVGRIELKSDVLVRGTKYFPKIEGSISATEGKIHYIGLDFDITHGFMEFRDPYGNAYLEVDAEQDVADAHITAKLYGRTNNLRIDLAGTSTKEGPLEKKDVLSLALFGMTTNERLQQAVYFQQEFGPELVAEQITHALQRPVAKATRLDVFRLEAKPSQTGRIQTFYLGKRLSDRFTAEFASEVNREEAIQSFRLEYWLTDFFVFKSARRTDQSYQMNLGLRFTGR